MSIATYSSEWRLIIQWDLEYVAVNPSWWCTSPLTHHVRNVVNERGKSNVHAERSI